MELELLVETAVGDVVATSTPTISSSLGLAVPVVLLDLRLLDVERAASTPKHIIELITPKVQVKVSKFHQKDIDIVTTHKLVNHKVNHKGTKKHPNRKGRKTKEQSWPKMATIYLTVKVIPWSVMIFDRGGLWLVKTKNYVTIQPKTELRQPGHQKPFAKIDHRVRNM